jgi:hypothetical protein
MRRSVLVALITLGALALTGLAVAKLAAGGTEAVSATFAATNVVRSNTHTCTGADGAYEITQAVYAGEADSANAALDGPIRIRVHSVYNTTEKLGWLEGWVHSTEDGSRTFGHIAAVNSNGTLDGFLTGRVSLPHMRLFGGLSAGWTQTGGFTNGKLGTGTSTDVALIAGRPCTGKGPGSAVKLTVHGTIESLSPTTIAVKPLDGTATQTCAVTNKSPNTSRFAQNDKVVMHCATIGGTLTLTRLHKEK